LNDNDNKGVGNDDDDNDDDDDDDDDNDNGNDNNDDNYGDDISDFRNILLPLFIDTAHNTNTNSCINMKYLTKWCEIWRRGKEN
jgi:hypothetical protein